MDSKKIKIIIAGIVLLVAVVLIARSIFSGPPREEAVEVEIDPEQVQGGPRLAPGYDPSQEPQ